MESVTFGLIMSLSLGLSSLIFVSLGLWFGAPYMVRKWGERVLRRRCRETRTIVLTYDDGPSPGLTPKLLDLLQRHDATASFFMLGQRLESSVETARTVIQRGHEIGSHSQTHLNAWKSLPWKVGKDLRDGFRAVDGLGAENVLFRPPHGKLTLHSMIQVFMSRRRLAWWTIDSTDTNSRCATPDAVAERVAGDGGGVVLLHDFDRGEDSPRNAFMLDVTRRLLEMAKNEGYKITTLGELLN